MCKVLLALLPLMALSAALEDCNKDNIAKLVASTTPLKKPISTILKGKYYVSATEAIKDDPIDFISAEVIVESNPKESKNITLVIIRSYPDKTKKPEVKKSQYVDMGDYLQQQNGTRNVYIAKCGGVFILHYCQVEGQKDDTETSFRFWVPMSLKEDEIKADMEKCKKVAEAINSALTWKDLKRPSDKKQSPQNKPGNKPMRKSL